MTPKQLEKRLDDSLQVFVQEMDFLIYTQDSEYLTKDVLEDISRQVFYALNDFKNIMVKYAKANSR